MFNNIVNCSIYHYPTFINISLYLVAKFDDSERLRPEELNQQNIEALVAESNLVGIKSSLKTSHFNVPNHLLNSTVFGFSLSYIQNRSIYCSYFSSLQEFSLENQAP